MPQDDREFGGLRPDRRQVRGYLLAVELEGGRPELVRDLPVVVRTEACPIIVEVCGRGLQADPNQAMLLPETLSLVHGQALGSTHPHAHHVSARLVVLQGERLGRGVGDYVDVLTSYMEVYSILNAIGQPNVVVWLVALCTRLRMAPVPDRTLSSAFCRKSIIRVPRGRQAPLRSL